ncbi:MAG: hypothetical protein ACRCWJ_06495 [Casimicrobium sp.]
MKRAAKFLLGCLVVLSPVIVASQMQPQPPQTVTIECVEGSLTVRTPTPVTWVKISMRDVMRVCLGE